MRKLIILNLFLIPAFLFAETLYVQSPVVKLFTEANAGGAGKLLKAGTELQKEGEQGDFFKVKSDSGSGYVLKVYVSKNPPSNKVNFGSSLDKTKSQLSRARSSQVSETASARGFSKSATGERIRGSAQDYDFDGVEWLEKIKIQEEEASKYQAE